MPAPLFLSHRSIVSVSGPDAEGFLNGILTVSTLGLRHGELRYGGLLTPQGKVIADMLLTRKDDAVLLDCAAVVAPALTKRLQLFKLRAAVVIGERFDLGVTAFEGEQDPRESSAPRRRIAERGSGEAADAAQYHAARIAAGLPEQGFDFATEEVFPADINMDLLGGVDFKKGCFVGQEVASRMKRRGTARRRTLVVEFDDETITPGPVLVAGVEIGRVTSVHGKLGLARLRIDEIEDAEKHHELQLGDDALLSVQKPHWLASELAAILEAKRLKRNQ